MIEEWILNNLNVVEEDDVSFINWGNGLMTEISIFISMFGDIIEQAINTNENVRQAIADNDNGRGYADLILN